jgi:CMP/dCMP kinase
MTSQRRRPVVAIDGPAGAGKSTVTRELAELLGYTRVDTGALYRSVAWLALQRGTPLTAEAQVAQVARELAAPQALGMHSRPEGTQVLVLGKDVSAAIRAQDVGEGASIVSRYPGVREALLDMQRQLGHEGGVVLEGRDIGTVVFPDAEVKFFLTASVEVRAARRQAELRARGEDVPLETIAEEVRERDRRDSTREIAPLIQAADAIVMDSSELTVGLVVRRMAHIVKQKESELSGK